MRPGELVQMRQSDLSVERDSGGEVWWVYTPGQYKTEHCDDEPRRIYLGAVAQMALREAIELNRSDGPQMTFGFHHGFDTDVRIWPWKAKTVDTARHSYASAMREALKLAKIDHCTPNQIRHAFATRAATVNIEGARAQLGHKDLSTTRKYIDENGAAARNLLDQL